MSIVCRCVITVVIIVSTVVGQDYPFFTVNDTTRLNDTIFLDHFSYVQTNWNHFIALGNITLRGGPLTSEEDFIDINANSQWDWDDINENGICDEGECEDFTDFNNNGILDNADEIGIFCAWEDTITEEPSDSLFCVGADYFDSSNPPWSNIRAWKDDDAPDSPEQDGYIQGYPINYRYWDASLETEMEIDLNEVSYVEFGFWDTTGNFGPSNSFSGINMKVDSPQYYQYTETHDNPHLFILNEPLEQGTELGLYTQDSLCVGGTILTGEYGQMFYAWNDDPDTPELDGFVDGDTVVLYLNRDGEESGPLNIEFVEYSVVVDGETVEWNTSGLFQEETISGIRLTSPSISTIPVEPILEDVGSFEPFNLNDFVTDPDDDITELTWSFSYLDTILDVNIDNDNIVTVDVLIDDWFGSEIVTFTAEDPSGGTGSRDVTFTVIPVNDSLFVENPIDDVTINEDELDSLFLVDLDDVFEDVDDSTFTFEWTSEDTGLLTAFINEDNEVTLFIVPDSFGVSLLMFFASDTEYTAVDSVLITVNPVNDAPVAGDVFAEVDEDSSIMIPLSVSDIDSDELTFVIIEIPENGTVNFVGSDSANYEPNTNFNGSDIFTFKVYDGGLYSEEATVTVTIHPVNDSPLALDDAYGTSDTLDTQEEGLPGVLANDSDIDSEFLIAQIIEGPDSGTVDLEPNGSFTYIPNAGFSGTDSFSYAAVDEDNAQSDPATVQITVSEIVIGAPIVEPDFYATNEDEPLSILSYDYGVLANDSDTSGVDTLSAQLYQTTSNGNLTFNSDGTFSYTPNTNYFGADTFYYQAFNGFLYSGPAVVTLTINPVNDAPIATGFFVETEENISVILDFAGNVTDPETPSDSLEYQILVLPIHGNMVDNVYFPDTSFYGEDSLTYVAIDDELLQSEPATVHIIVEQIIIVPIANAGIDIQESVSFPYDPILITLDGSQSTDEDGYIVSYKWYEILDTEEKVQIGSGGNPSIYFSYGDHFVELKVTDDEDADGIDTVLVAVIPDPNQPPVAEDIETTIDEDENISITLTGSDFETPNDLSFYIVDEPLHGSLSESRALKVFTYLPDENYFGIDSFTYAVTEENEIGGMSIESDTATVTITINPINDVPVLIFDTLQNSLDENTFIDISFNMTDGDDGIYASPLEFVVVNEPLYGQVTIDTTGSELTYTPYQNYFGNDNCVVKTVETTGDSLSSVPVQLSFTVINVNDPPVAYGYSYTLPEDSETFSFILQASDDQDISELTYNVFSPPNFGTFVSDGSNQAEYTPNLNFDGVDALVFNVRDNLGVFSDSAVVTLTIIPENDAPELIGEIADTTVLESSENIVINLADVFYDVENGSELTYSVSENVNGLTVNVTDSILTLSFAEGVSDSGTVDITASDNISRDVVSTSFNVEIISVNDPPVVELISPELDEDTELEIVLVASDPEGDSLIYSIIQAPVNGSLSPVANNSYLFLPNSDFFGSDSFNYRVSDGENQIDKTAQLLINAVNDLPNFITENLPDALENSAYETVIQVDDIDNSQEELGLSIISGPAWLGLEELVLSGTPGGNDAGIFDVTLELSDGLGSVSLTASLIVVNSNTPPIVENLNINVEEDNLVEFSLYASDPEGEEISFNVSSPGNGVLSGTAPNLIYTPNLNFFGVDLFTYTASDGDLESDTATVIIQVLGINDNPVAGDLTFEVDQSPFQVDFSSVVSDPDGDILAIITVPPSSGDTLSTIFGGSLIPAGDLIYDYIPPGSTPDADFMLYKATDGISETGLYIATFNLFGRSWSRFIPPSAFDDHINMAEDEIKEITFVGFDVSNNFPLDGTESVTITQAPVNGSLGAIVFSEASTIQLAQWNVEYIPQLNYFGTDTIRFTVTNPNNESGPSAEAVISIAINSVNDLPQMDTISDVAINEDNSVEINFTAADPDNVLESAITSSNEHLEVSVINDSTISITPELDYNGSGTINITATEIGGEGLSTSQLFTVDILPVNDAPLLSQINDITFNEDESATISLSSTDVDYVSLTYAAVINSDDIQVSVSNNLLTLAGSSDFNGEDTITVTVSDNEGAEDSQNIPVVIIPVNDAPILDELTSLTINEDSTAEVELSASDVDSQSRNLLPTQNFTVVITASSSDGTDVPLTFGMTTGATDNYDDDLDEYAPPAPPTGFDAALSWNGDRYFTQILAPSTEETTMPIAVSELYSFSWDPAIISASGQFIITDNFGGGFLSVDMASIGYLDESSTPFWGNISEFRITFTASESSDSQSLEFSATASEHINISLSGTTLTIIPEENWFGSEDIIISVSDGELTDSDELNVIVQSVNDAPVLSLVSDQEVDEDNSVDVFLNASDSDEDYLTYSVTDSGSVSASISGNVLTLTPPNNYNGESSISVSVTDGEFSDGSDFILMVNAVNDEPTVFQSLEDTLLLEDSGVVTMELSSVFADIDGDSLVYGTIMSTAGIITTEISGDILTISTLPDQYGGPVMVTVTAYEQQGSQSVNDYFEVMIEGINDPPILTSIGDQDVNEDNSINIPLQYDDIDTDLDSLTFDLTADPVDGLDTYLFDGYELQLQPTSDFFGEITVTVTVGDGEFDVSQNFNLTFLPVNDSPELLGITDITIDEDTDTTLVITPTDVDGDSIDIVITLGDTVLFDPDLFADTISVLAGEEIVILFQPEPNQNGSVDVVIIGSDGNVDVVRNLVVTVIATEDPPVAYAGLDTLLLSYQPWDPINYQLSGDGSEDSDGFITDYIWEDNGEEIGVGINPEVGLAIGVHTINLTVTDNDTLQSSDTVVVTVSGVPHAQDIVKVISEGSSTEFTLSGEDGEQNPLDIVIITFPENGELIGEIPVFEYVPDAEFFGSDTLIYSVSDGVYADTALVEIIVTSVNDIPEVDDVTVETDEDIPVEITLEGNDADGDELEFPVLIPPQHGGFDGEIYTPNLDFFGSDSFSYRAFDGQAYSDTATVTITINPVNDAPEIADIVDQSVLEDLVFTYTLSATDVEEDELTFLADVDSNATASIDGAELTVIPDADFNGEIEVTVTVYDSDLSDTTTFTLQVEPVNDTPVVNDLNIDLDEDTPVEITLEGYDVDGDSLTIEVVVGPTYGIYADGIYTPNQNYFGSDTLSYRAFDSQVYSDTAVVTIIINPVNDTPEIADIVDQSMQEDSVFTYTLSATDVDGDELTFSAEVDGNATVSVDGVELTVVPDPDFNGDVVVTVTVDDSDLSDSTIFTLQVEPVNDSPLVSDMDVETDEDIPVDITLTGSDVDEDELTFEVVDAPLNGSFTDGTYTPDENYYGSDSFTYHAFDGQIYSDIASVFINVNEINDPVIVANPMTDVEVDEDADAIIHANLDIVFSDVDNPVLTFTFDNSDTELLTASIDNENVLSFEFLENMFGSAVITVTASDGEYDSSDDVIVTVAPVNDPVEIDNALGDYDVSITTDYEYILGNLDDIFYDVEDDDSLVFSIDTTGSPLDLTVNIENEIVLNFDVLYAWDSASQTIVQQPQFIGETNVIFTATEPGGEYSISDTILVTDKIAPSFIVGVFQNPLATGHLEFYFFHSETLVTNPTAQINEDELNVVRHQGSEWGEDSPYYADYVSTEIEDHSLSVTATDTIGNTGSTIYNFFVQPVSGRMASTFSSFEDHFVINISENTFINDDQILLLPNDFMTILRYGLEEELSDNLIGNVLTIRSQQTHYGDKMAVGMHDENMDELLVQFPGFYRLEYGRWEYLETYYSLTEQKIWCLTEKPGTYVLRSEADRAPIEMPDKFALNQNYPNPFNPATTIVFDIPQKMFDRIEMDTRLVVYDLLGREIRTLVDSKMLSGRHKIIWNGKNNHGLNVASGIYFYRLNTHEFMQTNKMILLR